MGLSPRKLLANYFTVYELKDALDDIGETVSGRKGQLIGRILRNWDDHNRNIYSLFSFLDKDTLKSFCQDYGISIDLSATKDGMIGRIKRKDVFGLNPKEAADSVDLLSAPVKLSRLITASSGIEQIDRGDSKSTTLSTPPFVRRLRFYWRGFLSLGATIALYLGLPVLGYANYQEVGGIITFAITVYFFLRQI